MNPTILLVTEGKNESVDRAKVLLFARRCDAVAHAESIRTGYCKHWVEAVVLADGEMIDLLPPERTT